MAPLLCQLGTRDASDDFWPLANNLAKNGVLKHPAMEIHKHFHQALESEAYSKILFPDPEHPMREHSVIALNRPPSFQPIDQDRRRAPLKLCIEGPVWNPAFKRPRGRDREPLSSPAVEDDGVPMSPVHLSGDFGEDGGGFCIVVREDRLSDGQGSQVGQAVVVVVRHWIAGSK